MMEQQQPKDYERYVPEPRHPQDGLSKTIQAVIAGLVAVAGALGGYGVYQNNQVSTDPNARADPWTGTQAAEQERRIVDEHNADIREIKELIFAIQGQVRELEACKHRVETELKSMNYKMNDAKDDRERILGILEQAHPRFKED